MSAQHNKAATLGALEERTGPLEERTDCFELYAPGIVLHGYPFDITDRESLQAYYAEVLGGSRRRGASRSRTSSRRARRSSCASAGTGRRLTASQRRAGSIRRHQNACSRLHAMKFCPITRWS
jgi:hypothetical protein